LVWHWLVLAVPVPPLEPVVLLRAPPLLPPAPPLLPEAIGPAASLAADVGELLPDALVVPDPPDEHPASAAAVIAAVAETPETNLILFTRNAPVASVTRGS
jgi:hypothetical protein